MTDCGRWPEPHLAVFQRIEFGPPKAEIQVRFLAAGPDTEITASHQASKPARFPSVAGFSLLQAVSPRSTPSQRDTIILVGISKRSEARYQQGQRWHSATSLRCAARRSQSLNEGSIFSISRSMAASVSSPSSPSSTCACFAATSTGTFRNGYVHRECARLHAACGFKPVEAPERSCNRCAARKRAVIAQQEAGSIRQDARQVPRSQTHQHERQRSRGSPRAREQPIQRNPRAEFPCQPLPWPCLQWCACASRTQRLRGTGESRCG
jgi:hypothetical protein